jgi:hypothetical protein
MAFRADREGGGVTVAGAARDTIRFGSRRENRSGRLRIVTWRASGACWQARRMAARKYMSTPVRDAADSDASEKRSGRKNASAKRR